MTSRFREDLAHYRGEKGVLPKYQLNSGPAKELWIYEQELKSTGDFNEKTFSMPQQFIFQESLPDFELLTEENSQKYILYTEEGKEPRNSLFIENEKLWENYLCALLEYVLYKSGGLNIADVHPLFWDSVQRCMRYIPEARNILLERRQRNFYKLTEDSRNFYEGYIKKFDQCACNSRNYEYLKGTTKGTPEEVTHRVLKKCSACGREREYIYTEKLGEGKRDLDLEIFNYTPMQ